jgi:deazaflavin-dependent oxidoreductase (nitroreductase family)
MANPFASSKTFHKIGHITNTAPWRLLPTPRGLAVVTTTGRNTGVQRARAMRVVLDGDRAYAVALLGSRTDWLHNVRSNPHVRIMLGATTRDATARVLASEEELERAASVYRPIAGWYDYVDFANFVWSVPTKTKVVAVHDKWFSNGVPVVFELDPAGQRAGPSRDQDSSSSASE